MESIDFRKNRSYVVFDWSNSLKEFDTSDQFIGFDAAVKECHFIVNEEISDYNNTSERLKSRIQPMELSEVHELMENGQNIIIGNHTIGLIDVTPQVQLYDYIVLVKSDNDISDDDLGYLRDTYESKEYLRGYVAMFCTLRGAEYKIITSIEFDKEYRNLREYNYIVHAKVMG